jgi:hypothetical protein
VLHDSFLPVVVLFEATYALKISNRDERATPFVTPLTKEKDNLNPRELQKLN